MSRRALRGAALIGFAALALASSFARAAPAEEISRFAGELRAAAALVGASSTEIGALAARSEQGSAALAPAGRRLSAAAEVARKVLARYQGARTRYGTREEYELLRTMNQQLLETQAMFGTLAGSPAAAVTPLDVRRAEASVSEFRTVIALELESRFQLEGLADVLTATSFRGATRAAVDEFYRRVRVGAEGAIRRLTGIGIALNVPFHVQIRRHAEAYFSQLLAKLTIAAGPGAIVIQIVAGRLIDPGRIVQLLGAQLKAALRQRGNLAQRTTASLASLEAARRALNALRPDAPLDDVRAALRRAERALNATHFLEGDLQRAGKTDLLGRIAEAKARLERTKRHARFRFLLDAELLKEDFGLDIAVAALIRSSVDGLVARLPGPAVAFAAPKVVDRIKALGFQYEAFNIVACDARVAGACDPRNANSPLRQSARAFCQRRGTTATPSGANIGQRIGGQAAPYRGESPTNPGTTRTTAPGERWVIVSGQFAGLVGYTAVANVFASINCVT